LIKKDGKYKRKQLWRCKECKQQFSRKGSKNYKKLWREYAHGKQTYAQIAKKRNKTPRWVQQQIDTIHVHDADLIPGKTVVIMDTFYFGKAFGVVVYRCAHRCRNLLWKFVHHETAPDYERGLIELKHREWDIDAIVCDGKRGLFSLFPEIPTQMCHFHQVAIVIRYITRRPMLEAGKELKDIIHMLPKTNELNFRMLLQSWYEKWNSFLHEKTIDELTGNWHFTHKRLRSAYKSLQTNLPHLYIYQRYPDLWIPNTTNSLEGIFSHIKDKIRVHRGLKLQRKKRLIKELLRVS